MSDSYQAIFDAVRSRIYTCDPTATIQNSIREMGIDFAVSQACSLAKEVIAQYGYPSSIYRPSIQIDGDKWIALYGSDLQSGVAGSGNSPAEAMSDFDRAWFEKLKARET